MLQHPTFSIAGRKIGENEPPYVIAELGINHGGDVEIAHRMIDAAKESGADALKLQTYVTDQFLTRSSPYFNLLQSAALPPTTLAELYRHAKEVGVTMFSAVFDENSADLWEQIGAVAYKIASCDITHFPLLRHVARFGKPMILSTGGATMGEVEDSLSVIRQMRPDTPVSFLHCVSNYPTEPKQANLSCMATMRKVLGTPIGFSDHTIGNVVPIAAAALGADLLEKHFTLDRTASGPDHALSADPEEFRSMVAGIHSAWQAIGCHQKQPVESLETITAIRRSVTTSKPLSKGEVLTRDMLSVKRPGNGIAPGDIERVVGMVARKNISADQLLTWNDLVKS
jgi:N-acetylneuraminate synthase/N,N'-diacetyllegionaminate synthase